jgi:D-alanyl-D-alanine carboxypeptidase (penicillin-binding protein 5/6)
MHDSIQAPCTIVDAIGEVSYFYNGTEIGKVNIYAAESIDKAGYGDYFRNLVKGFF